MASNIAGRIFNKRGTRSNSYLKKNVHIYMEIDCKGNRVFTGMNCECVWGSGWQWPGLRGSGGNGPKQMDLGCVLEIELTELAGEL